MLKMTAKAVKKTSLLEYEFASASDSARLVYAKAMEGDGLRELGFGKPLSPYHEQDLDFGVLHIPETALKVSVVSTRNLYQSLLHNPLDWGSQRLSLRRQCQRPRARANLA